MKVKNNNCTHLDECEKEEKPKYRSPELVLIGKAVDLVQGYPSGKRSDGYTGYYWE